MHHDLCLVRQISAVTAWLVHMVETGRRPIHVGFMSALVRHNLAVRGGSALRFALVRSGIRQRDKPERTARFRWPVDWGFRLLFGFQFLAFRLRLLVDPFESNGQLNDFLRPSDCSR
jgi:hypothetical protein